MLSLENAGEALQNLESRLFAGRGRLLRGRGNIAVL